MQPDAAWADAPARAPARTGPPPWAVLGVLWLVGICLRLTILAVPPLLPAIHRSLHMDEKLVGALSGLPILVLAVAAVPGSFVISRLGARRALLLGLCTTGVAAAARGALPSVPLLFAMTFLMAVGIAVSQPTLPSLVRQWFGRRPGPATAVYSNGFLTGEILAAALTVPLVLPLVGGSWQWAFALWSVPVLITAGLLLVVAPRGAQQATDVQVGWWPDWRSGRTWRLGIIFGCASIAYFGSNAFLPDYLKATHHAQLISVTLTSLNVSQLPSSFLVAALPGQLVGRRWPLAASGGLILASALGFALAEPWTAVWAALLGFASALVFVLSLALPPLIARPADVHRLSAAMFTLSYTCAAAGSFLGGAIWDATRVAAGAFAPVMAGAVVMMVLAFGVKVHEGRSLIPPAALTGEERTP